MKRSISIVLLVIVSFSSCMQKEKPVKRPKLVVGLIIDQMRWDYLYRFYNRYSDNGFKRLMNKGFNCQNTKVNYLPTYTAPGHTCVYTGSVPSIHGIAGNNWVDNMSGKYVYCVDDDMVSLAGDPTKAPSMSPRNLLTTTITDELRLATNQKSRVYGIAIKDRGAILPAGHLANGAYWYNDMTGNFVTSTYYPNQTPVWLKAFNKRHLADSLLNQNWTLLYPAATYTQSTVDANSYEKGFKGEKAPVFPHIFDSLNYEERMSTIKSTPQGNTLTLQMARACVDGEHLGKSDDVDFLALSLSSSDYVGHQFAPNSMEVEDMYLRLDKEIASFLDYLDKTVGNDNYLFFLTADHAGAHNPTFLQDLDVPAGVFSVTAIPELNTYLKTVFAKDSIVKNFVNSQVIFNEGLITKSGLDKEKVKASVTEWLNKRPEIQYVIDMDNINKAAVPEPIKTMAINGYCRMRSGSVLMILNPGWYDNEGRTTGTTHGTWNPYDTHIPLLWYGWNVKKGNSYNEVNMTDISATLAAMLSIQMPNGCIGKPIPELMNTHSAHSQEK